jgi:sortase A
VFVGLVVLTLGALIFFGTDLTSQEGEEVASVERLTDPTGAGAPEAVSEEAAEDEEAVAEDEAIEEEVVAEDELIGDDEEEAAPVPPADATMRLFVPKLGISGAVVADGDLGLEIGASHLPGTGYPWLPGSNTYIAGHRVGFPGTGSDHIFYSLPSMAVGDEITLEDSNGRAYNYRVNEVFAVTPYDLWVTAPTGGDMVTLQVCTETLSDWWTIGPSLMSSGPDSGRLIVRAVPA